jgi:hypothetical protein
MTEQTLTDALLRKFLLGKIDDETRQQIESLFLTNSQAKERVLSAEEELIEEYLEDSLTTADRKLFLSRYAQTAEQQRKLTITKSIKRWAAAQAALTGIIPDKISSWSRLRSRLQLKPAVAIPIAISTLIAILAVAVWLNSRTERLRHFAIEEELASLNSPESQSSVPPQMVSIDVSPVTVRSVEQQAELKSRANIRIVELRLPWIQKERYSMYQAEIRRLVDRESFTIRNLQAKTDGRYAIRIRLPVPMLNQGQYRIHLSGITADGVAGPAEEYTFAVGG